MANVPVRRRFGKRECSPHQPNPHPRRLAIMRYVLAAALLVAGATTLILPVHAEDWPQWLGTKRDGVWREGGLVERFPEGGPKVRWRVPVGEGYTGPAVANGRVYLMDFQSGKG